MISPQEGEILLQVQGLSKSFGGVNAVVNFGMVLRSDHIVGLIGPNGAGKTTIFNLLSGIVPADHGRVTFLGQDITNKSSFFIARQGIGRTFQNVRLFDGLSVKDNVKTACCQDANYGILTALAGLPRLSRTERQLDTKVDGLLDLLGIRQYGRERARSLPYGLQRKVEIARALATNPRILLLDEPAAGLNPSEVVEMVSLITRLHNDYHFSIFLIEHHMDVVMPICDDIYVVNMGQTIACGTPQEIQGNSQVLTAYLGE